MSDTQDPASATAAATSDRLDELLPELRAAFAPDATQQARYTAAVSVARALLGSGSPAGVRNATPAPPAPSTGLPVEALLKTFAALPRDQVLQLLVSGVRTLFSPSASTPNYLRAPMPAAPAPPAPSAPTNSRSGRKS